MSQPKWKTVMSTDSSRILVDETGVYPAELEIADEVFDAPTKERFIVFRVVMDRLQLIRDDEDPLKFYLVGGSYKPDWGPPSKYEEWFVNDLKDVAQTCGTTVEEMVEELTSDDPVQRSIAYENIGRHHGFENFDSDPLRMSEAKLNKRWK